MIFPEGPLAADPRMPDARAWWPIDFEARLRLVQLGPEGEAAMEEATPEGMPQARRALLALVEDARQRLGLELHRTVLGGFSQGAMVTIDASLRLEEAPLGLAVLSGALVSAKDWRAQAPRRKGMAVFQSHGRQDPLLSYRGAEHLRGFLTDAGLNVQFETFTGGHTIPEAVLEGLGAFLEARA
jgi:phospholipase/carboxylesterase